MNELMLTRPADETINPRRKISTYVFVWGFYSSTDDSELATGSEVDILVLGLPTLD
jgi:hypothetical protein